MRSKLKKKLVMKWSLPIGRNCCGNCLKEM